ncbi:zinc finger and BTB domain-containing 18 isoform X5 [Clarias magur]|uniref:Zinc finger and BTB domain-containing 18 isoform X5 n=1 Tax=Clarias magur TaxID=1594786 RepID=A0A8J4TWD6_CLAMG|nr:zinc finger and BTB domain-containing 18 isoform X5 [Clarias magur]
MLGAIGKLSLARPDAESGGRVQMPQMETLEHMMQWAAAATVGTGSLSPTAGADKQVKDTAVSPDASTLENRLPLLPARCRTLEACHYEVSPNSCSSGRQKGRT